MHPEVDVDFYATNREDRPVLVGVVRARTLSDEDRAQELDYVWPAAVDVPFVMIVDYSGIVVYGGGKSDKDREKLISLGTRDVLQAYEHDIGEMLVEGEDIFAEYARKLREARKGAKPRIVPRIYEGYLTALIESWLRDLAYHSKTEHRPGEEEMRAIGLLDAIQGGLTTRACDEADSLR